MEEFALSIFRLSGTHLQNKKKMFHSRGILEVCWIFCRNFADDLCPASKKVFPGNFSVSDLNFENEVQQAASVHLPYRGRGLGTLKAVLVRSRLAAGADPWSMD